ncbi:hypothetical protein ACFLIM_37785 [Nonomuraea sp. M3C6]|uniref:Secreted protein n=1 Tax=Nonomuraea marmarensis TaxID=3351344 RepID=A0ABW7ANI5_9ACTN
MKSVATKTATGLAMAALAGGLLIATPQAASAAGICGPSQSRSEQRGEWVTFGKGGVHGCGTWSRVGKVTFLKGAVKDTRHDNKRAYVVIRFVVTSDVRKIYRFEAPRDGGSRTFALQSPYHQVSVQECLNVAWRLDPCGPADDFDVTAPQVHVPSPPPGG